MNHASLQVLTWGTVCAAVASAVLLASAGDTVSGGWKFDAAAGLHGGASAGSRKPAVSPPERAKRRAASRPGSAPDAPNRR